MGILFRLNILLFTDLWMVDIDELQHLDALLHGGDIINEHRAPAVHLSEATAPGMSSGIVYHAVEGLALVIRTLVVLHETEGHLSLLEHNLLASYALTYPPQCHHSHEFLGHSGDVAEPILQSMSESLHLIIFTEVIKLSVEQHPLAIAWQIGRASCRERV